MSKDAAFTLKKPPSNNNLFMPTDSKGNAAILGIGDNVVNIGIEKLKHYSKHPFKLYTGERQTDMAESIKANGVYVPLLIRPLPAIIPGELYEFEVLAGHNRLESGKIAGWTEMPCIIKHGLTDEEAHLIVTESNLLQRSFTDLSHSERAEALATHYDAIKHQGKRTDLIKQIEALLISSNADISANPDDSCGSASETCTPTGNKSIEVTGEKYGLSKNSVARYIRVNSLVPGLKELLDSEELSFRAGVSLSYMDEQRQQALLNQIQRYDVIPSMKQAEQLKQLAADINADADGGSEKLLLDCADILLGRSADEKPKPKKILKIKLERSAVESYFEEDDTEETIQGKVLEALEFYHQYYERYKNTDA
jgi:ParB family chromosome partitioning protein